MKHALIWLGAGSLALAAPASPPDAEEAAYPAIERFVEVLETVRERHPDVDRVTYERLVNHALEGMLASLDPHSSFIHPEMARQMKEVKDLQPEIASIGLTLGVRDDGMYVSAVTPGGSAAGAGVLPGSQVLTIDGNETKDVGFADLLGRFSRPSGETTTLSLKSPAEPRPMEVKLVHRVVEQRSVTEVKMLNVAKKTGYIRLGSFGNTCAREVEAALDSLEDEGMKSLILDLRQNGGGSLPETVKILGLFLPPSTLVVTTRGRAGETEEPLKTPPRQRRKRDYPVAVLVDRMSASASELTAGALQDLKRAVVVGETSYGKGSVQNIIPMGGGTALRLTIATYHTPSGNTPHLKGVTPDIKVAMDEKTAEMFLKTTHIHSLSPKEKQEVESWKDPVLEAAEAALDKK